MRGDSAQLPVDFLAGFTIFILYLIMIADSFGVHIPPWVSPVIIFGVVGCFLLKSRQVVPALARDRED